MKKIAALAVVLSVLVPSIAGAKDRKPAEPTHCVTTYVLGGVVTTCR